MTDTTITDASAEASAARTALARREPAVDERVEDLLAEMTLEEKAGLFFQTHDHDGQDGELAESDPVFGLPSNRRVRARASA